MLQPQRLPVILDCCHAAGMGVKDVGTLPGHSSVATTAISTPPSEEDLSQAVAGLR